MFGKVWASRSAWKAGKEAANVDDERSQLLTPQQVSELLQMPLQTLYTWRSRGEGPPALKLGRHLRYRRADVERWLDEGPTRSSVNGRRRSVSTERWEKN
jgi:excisionase family DNA binding protein